MNYEQTVEEQVKAFEKRFGAFAIMGKLGRLYNGAFANEARISDANEFLRSFASTIAEAVREEEKDYIVVKNEEIAMDLLKTSPPSLKGKYIIIAPDGLEFVSKDDIAKLPQVKELAESVREEERERVIDFLEQALFEQKKRGKLQQKWSEGWNACILVIKTKLTTLRKDTLEAVRGERIISMPKMHGKSTFVKNSFLASCKAGEYVEYRHPDYVCMSKKRYEKLIEAVREEEREKFMSLLKDEPEPEITITAEGAEKIGTLISGSKGRNQLRKELRTKLTAIRKEGK